MPHDDDEQTTRRRVLQQLTGVAAASGAFPIFGQNPPPENHHSSAPVTRQAAEAYRYQYFSPAQLNTLDAVAETIIPADDHSPGAKAAAVSEYIDAIVADGPEETKRIWDAGLALADRNAINSFGKAYAALPAEHQIAVMKAMADEAFFRVLKRAAIDGYYTSSIGIHDDLQYQGNEAVSQFPGCLHEEGHQ